MKCPNCGQEIEAEHLYCEKCGMEIRIVPDFEPEIENSITETLSTVAETIEEKIPEKAEKEETEHFFVEESGKKLMMIRVITFVVIILVALTATLFTYFNYSVPYQIEKAREYANQGNYKEAVRYLNKASDLEEENASIELLKANYYYYLGDVESAANTLIVLIEKAKMEYEDAEKAYEYLIAIYDEQGKYQEINKLLLDCQEPNIVTLFQNYMAMEPEFSYVGGSYDEVIPLKISANTTGTIYYTLDGTTPTTSSQIYTAPLFLESGKYQVCALFVNDYGIESNVVSSWYEINLTVPKPPQVMLYSGKYEIPTLIEVIATGEGKIYYTTDGSEPNTDSLVYNEPLEMPLGRSNFKFAVISDAGVSSEVVSRSFEFKLNTDITLDIAVSNVCKALMERKVLKDLQGTAQDKEGKYVFVYDTVVEIDGSYYYVLEEYFEVAGSQTKTGLLYAVEVYTGSPNRLVYDNGQMGLISLAD